jgi:hypothetical protein
VDEGLGVGIDGVDAFYEVCAVAVAQTEVEDGDIDALEHLQCLGQGSGLANGEAWLTTEPHGDCFTNDGQVFDQQYARVLPLMAPRPWHAPHVIRLRG